MNGEGKKDETGVLEPQSLEILCGAFPLASFASIENIFKAAFV